MNGSCVNENKTEVQKESADFYPFVTCDAERVVPLVPCLTALLMGPSQSQNRLCERQEARGTSGFLNDVAWVCTYFHSLCDNF